MLTPNAFDIPGSTAATTKLSVPSANIPTASTSKRRFIAISFLAIAERRSVRRLSPPPSLEQWERQATGANDGFAAERSRHYEPAVENASPSHRRIAACKVGHVTAPFAQCGVRHAAKDGRASIGALEAWMRSYGLLKTGARLGRGDHEKAMELRG